MKMLPHAVSHARPWKNLAQRASSTRLRYDVDVLIGPWNSSRTISMRHISWTRLSNHNLCVFSHIPFTSPLLPCIYMVDWGYVYGQRPSCSGEQNGSSFCHKLGSTRQVGWVLGITLTIYYSMRIACRSSHGRLSDIIVSKTVWYYRNQVYSIWRVFQHGHLPASPTSPAPSLLLPRTPG